MKTHIESWDYCAGCWCTETDACFDEATGRTCSWYVQPSSITPGLCSACAIALDECALAIVTDALKVPVTAIDRVVRGAGRVLPFRERSR
jgi:hypothetical protein